MSALITVQLDAVAALAAELAALAAELTDDPPSCDRSAGALDAALDGTAGVSARTAAATWGVLIGVVTEQVAATARSLSAAVESYRAADAGLGESIRVARPGMAVPR